VGGPDHVVKLMFDDFMTEKLDVVKVYDGSSVNAPLLRSISGSLESMPSFVSTGSQMTLRFKTDGSVVYSGWRAHFESIDVMTTRMPMTTTSAANALCGDKSWHHYKGSCYKLFPERMTWTAAKSHCESHAAHLATIGDRKENEFVSNVVHNESFYEAWIGSRKDQQYNFAWIDTTNFSFSNWEDGEPEGSGTCVLIR